MQLNTRRVALHHPCTPLAQHGTRLVLCTSPGRRRRRAGRRRCVGCGCAGFFKRGARGGRFRPSVVGHAWTGEAPSGRAGRAGAAGRGGRHHYEKKKKMDAWHCEVGVPPSLSPLPRPPTAPLRRYVRARARSSGLDVTLDTHPGRAQGEDRACALPVLFHSSQPFPYHPLSLQAPPWAAGRLHFRAPPCSPRASARAPSPAAAPAPALARSRSWARRCMWARRSGKERERE